MSHIADERIDEFAKAFVAYLRRILAEQLTSQIKKSKQEIRKDGKKIANQ